MKSLIFHTNEFKTRLTRKSNRPKGIISDKKSADEEIFGNGVLVFLCVEKGDDEKKTDLLYDEIEKAAKEVKTKDILLSPFVHLSKNIADSETAKEFFKKLYEKVKDSGYTTNTAHFGYHKSVKLDIKGHPGSVRYREF